MPLDDLPEAVRNPKAHDEQGIDASLDRFGYVEPAVLDERTGRLVSGHGRKRGLQAKRERGEQPPEGVELGAEGVWLVPVYRGWTSRSDAEAEAYLLAANRLTERGGWQNDGLASLLQELAGQEGGLDGTGYTADDLTELVASLTPPSGPDFDPAPADAQPRLDVRNPTTCPKCGHQFHKA